MTFSQTAEYALRAVVWLAQHHGQALGTAQIAAATRVPPGYLSKVLQALARMRVVSSSPGRAGGFRLLRPPEELSVLDVVNAVDPVARIRHCPLEIESHRRELCPLHRRLDQALSHVERALGEATIAELLSESASAPPLCAAKRDPRRRRRRPGAPG